MGEHFLPPSPSLPHHLLMDRLIAAHRERILSLAERHGARNVRLFGSRAGGEASSQSDVDLLVDMDRGKSLLDLIALEEALEDLLGTGVDVATPSSISEFLRAEIEREAVPL